MREVTAFLIFLLLSPTLLVWRARVPVILAARAEAAGWTTDQNGDEGGRDAAQVQE